METRIDVLKRNPPDTRDPFARLARSVLWFALLLSTAYLLLSLQLGQVLVLGGVYLYFTLATYLLDVWRLRAPTASLATERLLRVLVAVSAFLAIIFLIILSHRAAEVKTKNADQTTDRAATAAQPATWEQLAALAPEQLQRVDVATVNLLCAAGLAGAEGLDIASCRRTLDQWAERVRSETERNWHRFRDNPSEFEHSEGYFRMLLTAVVFYEDFHIRYNPSRMTSAASASPNDKFFADSRDVFLHGLLGPRHSGTCSSLPVLYVAIGRRLGYPLKLVTTKAHLFLRWEDDKERFNLEATGKGMNRYDDEHFKQWPFPVTEAEVVREHYLQSLTPREELAVFVSLRGNCEREAGRRQEAARCFGAASRLAPDWPMYRALAAAPEVAGEAALRGGN